MLGELTSCTQILQNSYTGLLYLNPLPSLPSGHTLGTHHCITTQSVQEDEKTSWLRTLMLPHCQNTGGTARHGTAFLPPNKNPHISWLSQQARK